MASVSDKLQSKTQDYTNRNQVTIHPQQSFATTELVQRVCLRRRVLPEENPVDIKRTPVEALALNTVTFALKETAYVCLQ